MIADRDTPSNHSEVKLKVLADKIDLISKKVERLHEPHSANNIVINSCLPHSRPQIASSHTQTESGADDIQHTVGDPSASADSYDMQHDDTNQDENLPSTAFLMTRAAAANF